MRAAWPGHIAGLIAYVREGMACTTGPGPAANVEFYSKEGGGIVGPSRQELIGSLRERVQQRFAALPALIRNANRQGAPAVESPALVTFRLPNDNEVRMLGDAALGEVMMGEISRPDAGEVFLVDPGVQPVELFRRLAPENSPVPKLLLQLDAAGVLRNRTVVEAVEAPIPVPAQRLAAPSPAATATRGGSCQQGAAGAEFFEQHHCNTSGGPGYGKRESYCYPGASGTIQKTSRRRRRATYTRTAACGSGTCRIRHYYRTAGGYHTQLMVHVQAPAVSRWWSAKSGIARYRRVRFEALGSEASVRGWVRFHSQVAEWSIP